MTSDSTPGRRRGLLPFGELERLIHAGELDTVIVGFADMQGRLTGKRVSARLFVEEVAAHGAECCNYLLAVDVDMNTVPGYAMSSWETGYGDMVMRPDLGTLRLLPWLPGTPELPPEPVALLPATVPFMSPWRIPSAGSSEWRPLSPLSGVTPPTKPCWDISSVPET